MKFKYSTFIDRYLKSLEGPFVSVADEWSGNISLSVGIINSFDHDGDGTLTNQTGEATFNFLSGIQTL